MKITELYDLSYGKWVYYFVDRTTKERVTEVREIMSDGKMCFRIPWPEGIEWPKHELKWYGVI